MLGHAVPRPPLTCTSFFERSFSATLPGDSLTYQSGYLPGHSCERPAAEDRAPMPGDTLWLSDQQTKHFAPQSLGRRAAGAHVSRPEGRRSRHMPGAHHSSKGQPLCSAFTRLPCKLPLPLGSLSLDLHLSGALNPQAKYRFQSMLLCQGFVPAKVSLAPGNGHDPSPHMHPLPIASTPTSSAYES